MPIKIHDSREPAEDRFTAHAWLRDDVQSASAVEVDIETYGPSEDAARARMRAVMFDLAARLLAASAE